MVDLGEPVHETREKAADMSEIPAKWLGQAFPPVNLIYLITC